MPGACREQRSPLVQPEESVGWSALGPGGQQVSCPAYLAGTRQHATAGISAAAWLRQWVKAKAREPAAPAGRTTGPLVDEASTR